MKEMFDLKAIIPDDLKAYYQDRGNTKLTISQGKEGELKVVCEDAKYAKYLGTKLASIEGCDGLGKGDPKNMGRLNIFFANENEGCKCFYITSTKSILENQTGIVHLNPRAQAQIDEQEEITEQQGQEKNHQIKKTDIKSQKKTPAILSNYGVYKAGNGEFALSLPSIEMRDEVVALLGLNENEHFVFHDQVNQNKERIRTSNTIYFYPNVLSFEMKEENRGQQSFETEVKLDGINKAIGEGKEVDNGNNHNRIIHKYKVSNMPVILKALFDVTARDEGKVSTKWRFGYYDGYSYEGFLSTGPRENLGFQWVKEDGNLKLLVSYHVYDRMSDYNRKCTCLLSFNKEKNEIITEIPKDSFHSMPDNQVGSVIIDFLTEWSEKINKKESLVAAKKSTIMEQNGAAQDNFDYLNQLKKEPVGVALNKELDKHKLEKVSNTQAQHLIDAGNKLLNTIEDNRRDSKEWTNRYEATIKLNSLIEKLETVKQSSELNRIVSEIHKEIKIIQANKPTLLEGNFLQKIENIVNALLGSIFGNKFKDSLRQLTDSAQKILTETPPEPRGPSGSGVG